MVLFKLLLLRLKLNLRLDKKKYTLSGYVINVSILIHSLYRRLDYYKITADGNFLIDV